MNINVQMIRIKTTLRGEKLNFEVQRANLKVPIVAELNPTTSERLFPRALLVITIILYGDEGLNESLPSGPSFSHQAQKISSAEEYTRMQLLQPGFESNLIFKIISACKG